MRFIEDIIPELIAQHSCVVVPGFGGFISRIQPAQINYEKGTMVPPFRSVLFNRQLLSDDGVLIHSLVSRTGKSYDALSLEIKEKVHDWNNILNEGGRIEIDRLGVFFKDHEGKVQFEQDRFFNLLLSSYGLETVRFMPAAEVVHVAEAINEKEEVIIPVKEHEAEVISIQVDPVITRERSRVYIRYAAAAVLLPIAFYSFWIPVKTDVLESGVISLKDFNPFYKKKDGQYNPEASAVPGLESIHEKVDLESEFNSLPLEIEVYSYKFTPEKFIPVKMHQEADKVDEKIIEGTVEANAMNFIVGCFANQSNADNLVKRLKQSGLPAFILDQSNGLYRVSAGSALSEESLNEISSTAAQLGFKGWVLK